MWLILLKQRLYLQVNEHKRIAENAKKETNAARLKCDSEIKEMVNILGNYKHENQTAVEEKEKEIQELKNLLKDHECSKKSEVSVYIIKELTIYYPKTLDMLHVCH